MARKKKVINYDVAINYQGSDDTDYYSLNEDQYNDLQECIASERKWFSKENDSGVHYYINLENVAHFSIEESDDD